MINVAPLQVFHWAQKPGFHSRLYRVPSTPALEQDVAAGLKVAEEQAPLAAASAPTHLRRRGRTRAGNDDSHDEGETGNGLHVIPFATNVSFWFFVPLVPRLMLVLKNFAVLRTLATANLGPSEI